MEIVPSVAEKAANRAHIVHDGVVHVSLLPDAALGDCSPCLGHVFL